MSNLKRGSPIPKPATDPLDGALAELKKLPAGERLTKGKPYLHTIVEIVLKHPNRSAAIEEADIACGAGIVKAQDLRMEIERAAIDQMKPPAAAASQNVRVMVELAEQQFEERGAPEFDPYEEAPLRWFPPGHRF
jgi:hypothetical protein